MLKFGLAERTTNMTEAQESAFSQSPQVVQRLFYVPHLALRTSSDPRDLILLPRNGKNIEDVAESETARTDSFHPLSFAFSESSISFKLSSQVEVSYSSESNLVGAWAICQTAS